MIFKALFLFFSILVGAISAQAAVEDLSISAEATPINVAPGKVETLKLKLNVPPKFHAYSDKLQIGDIQPPAFNVGQIQISKEVDFYDKFSRSNKKGFVGDVIATLQVEPPIDLDPATKELKFQIKYQICSEKICYLPKSQMVKVDVMMANIAPAKKPNIRARLDNFMNNFEIENFQDNIYLALLICFLAGVLTSFTPCIFPMIPITISILGHDAEKNSRRQNFMRSAIYVLGIALTYSSLGVLAALTGQLFGNLLANRYVLIAMSLLFFTMALSMWGLYDLQMPAFIRNRFGSGKKQGYLGIFAMGLIAGIVASPCVGPVLISILSYVSTTKNALLGFGLLFSYAIGLGLIFIFIGLFGQMLSYLPRSGAWMNKIKYILGTIMILMGLYYLQIAFPEVKHAFQKTETPSASIKAVWLNYSEADLKRAQAEQRPVLIDFRADWCGACVEMEEQTFARTQFAELSQQFMLLKVDATNESPELQKILDQYDVKGLPTTIFVNRKGIILKNLNFSQFMEWNELQPKMMEALKEN